MARSIQRQGAGTGASLGLEGTPRLKGASSQEVFPRRLSSLGFEAARHRCLPSRGKGVTLIEMLVALTFMGVITVGMTGLAIAILNGNAKSRSTGIAVYLAQDRLETIRNTAYGNILSGNFPGDSPLPAFHRTTAIQADTPIAGMKRIVVTVSWPGGSVREEMLVGQ